MAVFKKPTPMDEQLNRIAKADTVAFGGVGVAGALLPPTQAYFTLEEALAAHKTELRPRLERLLDGATPAGRIYAAELLTHLDAAAGHAAWQRLAGQQDEVSTFSGCFMGKTTVGRYATDRLRPSEPPTWE
jgi:hypothetical protein